MNAGMDFGEQLDALAAEIGQFSDIDDIVTPALDRAVEKIAASMRRVFSRANFKRDKRNVQYRYAGAELLKKFAPKTSRKGVLYATAGFDTETIRRYPELIEIEYGRPGKSRGHTGKTDSRGRKKGVFPEYAVVMPVRVGFDLVKETVATEFYNEVYTAIMGVWAA